MDWTSIVVIVLCSWLPWGIGAVLYLRARRQFRKHIEQQVKAAEHMRKAFGSGDCFPMHVNPEIHH